MLLPSSIQRAEDFVGIAIPTVGLLCARAPLPDAAAARLASASANNVVFRLGIFAPFTFFNLIGRHKSRVWLRRTAAVGHLLWACMPDNELRAPGRSVIGRPLSQMEIMTLLPPC